MLPSFSHRHPQLSPPRHPSISKPQSARSSRKASQQPLRDGNTVSKRRMHSTKAGAQLKMADINPLPRNSNKPATKVSNNDERNLVSNLNSNDHPSNTTSRSPIRISPEISSDSLPTSAKPNRSHPTRNAVLNMETSAPIPPWRPTTTTMVWKTTSDLSTEPIKSTTTRATTSHRTTLCLQPWNLTNTETKKMNRTATPTPPEGIGA